MNFRSEVPGLEVPPGPLPSFCCKMLLRYTTLFGDTGNLLKSMITSARSASPNRMLLRLTPNGSSQLSFPIWSID